MARKVQIKKTVFDRESFNQVIDNKFKHFRELPPVIDPDTVEELFRLYDKLYAVIPIEGEDNSHQYLVERSSELYKVDSQLESIQPLLDEVASLRGQLLENNRRILELETQLAGGGELNFEDAEQMQLLRSQLEAANATISTLEQANTLANRATEQATKASEEAAKKAMQRKKAEVVKAINNLQGELESLNTAIATTDTAQKFLLVTAINLKTESYQQSHQKEQQ